VKNPVILVVDDDPQVLGAVRRDLRARYARHYSIMVADSGSEALEALRELKAKSGSLALLISDQQMPGMPGHVVLTASIELYPQARRVLLTAYSDIGAAVKAINEAHVNHYLTKPWDPPDERLYPVVDDLLDEWQAEREPEVAGLRLIGLQWSPRSHAIKDFLAGLLVPYRWIDAVRDEAEAAPLLTSVGATVEELPVLLFEDGSSLRDPQPREIAERLKRPMTATHETYDLVIVGAGPAGLAAAVYGASEGLKTLLLDCHGPGGQAASSSRIENYLGFPSGVSGSELTRRAIAQAERLGAEFLAPLEVMSVTLEDGYKRLKLADGRDIIARTMLVSTGMIYREHPAQGCAEHTGAGVYYGAATTEAPAFRGQRVIVVGGGNSAGQGALHLARFAEDVQIVVRRGLAATMSRYLIDQIEKTPNVAVRTGMELEAVHGEGRVERVTLRHAVDGSTIEEPAGAVFVFIGTRPRTDWLPDEVLRDAKHFVLTGRDLMAAEAYRRVWKEPREPLPLETSVPGVFAAGDVRAGAMNRVASAVGEGSMVVRLVHECMALT
jgi:thioredoxin reductase (NADPH)